MKILAESAAHFWVYAACSGWLSAVQPWELVEDDIAPLSNPDNTLPQTITLYLEPSRTFTPQASSLPFFFDAQLKLAGLGKSVKCFVYDNIDPNTFSAQINHGLGIHETFTTHKITSPAARSEMFAKGHVAVWVNGGDVLARSSAYNASAPGRFMAEFGVMTDTGLVDPVFFLQAMQTYLHDAAQFGAFKNLFGTNWPFLAPSPTTIPVPTATAAGAINAAQQRLYPAPALYEAKQRLSLTNSQWRAVGAGQKSLYWNRLRRSSSHATTGAPFVFDTRDMANPFQLEAVAEFFMAWPAPSSGGTAPPENPPQAQSVDLQTEPWNLVFIDPFHHLTLGDPPLPKPDYFVKKHVAADSTRCDSANPLPSPFNADAYSAVLFLVHRGEVKAWHRWSTYTSHKWECQAYNQCYLASSAVGNRRYFFRSQTAMGKRSKIYINYAFILSDALGGAYIPGKYYFRNGLPDDDGTAPGDDKAKKSGVMVHNGETVSIVKSATSYNGSGGCLVSPCFPRLRNTMIELFLEDDSQKPEGSRDTKVQFLRHRTNSQSKKIRGGDTKMKDGTLFLPQYWDGKISGLCYVIRPDEPIQK